MYPTPENWDKGFVTFVVVAIYISSEIS